MQHAALRRRSVTLPFTHAQFLDVLGEYNAVLWPVAAMLWLATLAATVRLLRGDARASGLAALLALHWAWSGIAYHAVFFTRINPAAWGFAGLFVLGSGAFVWFGVMRHRLAFDVGWTPRHVLAGLFIVYALAYPGLVLLTGLQWPRMPAFGVPCPTTLFTASQPLLMISEKLFSLSKAKHMLCQGHTYAVRYSVDLSLKQCGAIPPTLSIRQAGRRQQALYLLRCPLFLYRRPAGSWWMKRGA